MGPDGVDIPTSTTAATASPARRDTSTWAAPALTGISTPDWNTLTTELVLPYQAYREAELHVRRGGPCWRKPAGGQPPALTLEEKLLITVLRARYRMPQRVLAELFGVADTTIATAERRIKPLLDQRQHTITPTGIRFRTLDELAAHAATHSVSLNPTPPSAC